MIPIDATQWSEFTRRFSHEHDGWSASVQVRGSDGAVDLAVEDRPFRGLTFENRGGHEVMILSFGDDPEEHLAHIVEHPQALSLLDHHPRECSLVIGLADGSGCVLELDSPFHAD